MARSSTINIKILGDNKDLRKALGDSQSRLSSFAKSAGKAVALGVAGAAVGLGALGKSAYDAAIESQKIGAQTGAVIKSMGLESTVTAARIGDLATELSLKNAVDDEAIQTGQNLLLTFKNLADSAGTVGGEFDRASQVMVDMGAAMGTDASASAIQLGKALNDPVKGITALTRVGVSFTEEQKDQIKAMAKAGDVAGAQGVILSELENQFGGSAAAQATAADRMQIALGNLQEEIGAYLIPIIEKLSRFLTDKLLPVMNQYLPRAVEVVRNAINNAVTAFHTMRSAIQAVIGFFADNQHVLAAVATLVGGALVAGIVAWTVATYAQVTALYAQAAAFVVAHAPIIAIIAVLAALVAGVVYAYQNFETFRNVVDAVRAWMVNDLLPAIKATWKLIQASITTAIAVAQTVIETFVAVVRRLWEQFGEQITNIVRSAFDTMKTLVKSALDIIRGVIQTVTSLIKGDWSGAWNGIKLILSGVWTAMRAIVSHALTVIKNAIKAAFGVVDQYFSRTWNAIKGFFRGVWDSIVGFVSGGIDDIIDFVGSIPGRVAGAIGNGFEAIYDKFASVANRIIDGWNGLEFSMPSIDTKIPGIGKIGGFSVGTPNIPRLHTGGIVQGRAGAEVPIIAQAGEGVFTRDQMAALGSRTDGPLELGDVTIQKLAHYMMAAAGVGVARSEAQLLAELRGGVR